MISTAHAKVVRIRPFFIAGLRRAVGGTCVNTRLNDAVTASIVRAFTSSLLHFLLSVRRFEGIRALDLDASNVAGLGHAHPEPLVEGPARRDWLRD
jgi:hypothetical protein